jgi:error-prone DNA polymerase
MIPLHCHSTFSFHAGICTPREIVARAKAYGLSSIALTDTDRVSGLILFYQACQDYGIDPILGVELTDPSHMSPPLPCSPAPPLGEEERGRIVLLAKNATGYGDLCEITTQRHVDPAFSFARIFSKPWPNLFILTAFPDLLELLDRTPNRPNLYGELVNNSAITRRRSHALAAKAKALGIPLVATNNSYFLHPDDHDTHKTLTAIGLVSTMSRLKPHEYASRNAFLRPADQMERLFPNHPEAIRNTERIADQCQVELDLGKWILPQIEVPEGHTPDTYLKEVADNGLFDNYAGCPEYDSAKAIQDMELEVIKKLGYSSYFLMVMQVRNWANDRLKTAYRRPKDCTILRGSAANSITFYNIGASDLDPIKYDLYFQRFLNEDRASPPDADLDFGWDERDEILQHVVDRWGRERVALTCTTNHFRGRAAFRETAKVIGYTEEEISEIQKSLKTKTRRVHDDELERIMTIATKIKGKPRFLGQHPGGLLITNDPICRHVACEYSGGEKNRLITQIDMHNGIDDLGLIKFDLLGNGSLSVLRDTLAQVEEQNYPDPEVWDLEKCYHDEHVLDVIRKGRTKGIFYIESPAQTRLNKKSQVESFEELTITSSLVRPAGASYTATFIERHRKKKAGIVDWHYLHPSLEPILNESHDVCAFQEDVTKICHHVAGLSFKKADKIRKMMNSLHEGEQVGDIIPRTAEEFMQGCMDHSGLTREQAVELWTRVGSFTGFSFCKSHSASYAQLSFQCTYLKAYYPAQFIASVISNEHGFYTKEVYLNEARRWGITILPMNINASRDKYWGKHEWIRPGMMHVRNLTQKSLGNLLHERRTNGDFRNLVDFVERVDIGRKEIEKLILVGAFDGYGLAQPEMLYQLDGIYGKLRPSEPTLFQAQSADIGNATLMNEHPGLDDYTLAERCLNELYLLGFMLSGNILEILDMHPASRNAVPANQIPEHKDQRIKVFGWPVTRRVHHVEHSGQPMLFITIEDKTEVIDVILWPDVYDRFADVMAEPGPFEMWGIVSEEWGTYTVEADMIKAVSWSPNMVDLDLASKRLEKSFSGFEKYADIKPTVAA